MRKNRNKKSPPESRQGVVMSKQPIKLIKTLLSKLAYLLSICHKNKHPQVHQLHNPKRFEIAAKGVNCLFLG
ncbi:MAG TPA: hypothetical protein VG738_07550 [Chitinophagaceae bacterium]|nr:hypothetical protein [Chitinophagaceae bacterium]